MKLENVVYPKLKEAIIESNSKEPSVTESSSYISMIENVTIPSSTSSKGLMNWPHTLFSGFHIRIFRRF